MRLTLRHTFAADPRRVHALLVDQGFLEHTCRELGAREFLVEAGDDESTVAADVPTPDAVRGFLGPLMRTRQEHAWDAAGADGSRTGTVMITVAGAPFLVTGVTALRPVAGGTEYAVDADLSVSVPLIGRTIERSAAPEITGLLQAQARLADTWLARP